MIFVPLQTAQNGSVVDVLGFEVVELTWIECFVKQHLSLRSKMSLLFMHTMKVPILEIIPPVTLNVLHIRT